MATTFSDYTYRINGIISTDKTVLQNLDILTGACATWMTYDTHDGQWAVVVNQTGTSRASFTDANILGAITISGSGIDRLYNSVRVEFPHIDLNDEKDYILDSIPYEAWFPNEIPNTLNMQFDCINNPVQAEYVGLIELKQGRLDQVVRFQSDFSQLGLKAGDLIDITNTVYGFTNKVFRILSIKESDTEAGAIILDITAQEYDDQVYSTTDLYRYVRNNSTGIATIGAIGVPGTPTVSKIELDSRPRVTISSTVPTGKVESLEFWYTTDTYTYDTNRVYTLLDTIKPSAGNTLTYGNTITVVNDALPSGNLYVKTRGVNGQTTGPFSTPAGFVYTPKQVTDTIGPDTTITDSSGSIVTQLGALALMSAVNGLFSGNTGSGSLFGKIFDVFKSNTGVDILGNASSIASGASSLPSQTGNNGKYLKTNGTTTSWAYPVANVYFGPNAASQGWTSTNMGSGKWKLELGQSTGSGNASITSIHFASDLSSATYPSTIDMPFSISADSTLSGNLRVNTTGWTGEGKAEIIVAAPWWGMYSEGGTLGSSATVSAANPYVEFTTYDFALTMLYSENIGITCQPYIRIWTPADAYNSLPTANIACPLTITLTA